MKLAASLLLVLTPLNLYLVSLTRRGEVTAGDAIAVMVGYGANCFRLRLFVNPKPRDEWGGFTGNNLEYTLSLAKRVKALGAKLVLDLHYSDTWADPQRQEKPAAWANLSFGELVDEVYSYTRSVVSRFVEEGVAPDYVQVGNEITCGMLWPDGKVCDVENPEEQWGKLAALLKAAVKGVRDGSGGWPVKVVVHLHTGGDWGATRWFLEKLEEHGVEYDVVGLSYYPWWQGSLEGLRENIEGIVRTFEKEVVVVETAYPWRSTRVEELPWAKPEHMVWSSTPYGQREFLEALVETVKAAGGSGVLWWEPAAVPVTGLTLWLNGSTALFDAGGHPLPALKSFKSLRERVGPDFLLGGDISSLGELERLGARYFKE